MRVYELDEHYFKKIDREDKAYWLGFIFAEGCIRPNGENALRLRLLVSEKDTDHLKKFLQYVNANYPIRREERVVGGKIYRVSFVDITSTKFARSILKYGFKRKEKIPSLVPSDLIPAFVRGFFDGDGSITFRKERNGISKLRIALCGSRSLLEDINYYAPVKLKIYPNKTICSLEGTSEIALEFLDWIYNGATVYLERKYNRYLQAKNLPKSKQSHRLSAEDKALIFKLHSMGVSQAEIARKLGITQQCVWYYLHRATVIKSEAEKHLKKLEEVEKKGW